MTNVDAHCILFYIHVSLKYPIPCFIILLQGEEIEDEEGSCEIAHYVPPTGTPTVSVPAYEWWETVRTCVVNQTETLHGYVHARSPKRTNPRHSHNVEHAIVNSGDKI